MYMFDIFESFAYVKLVFRSEVLTNEPSRLHHSKKRETILDKTDVLRGYGFHYYIVTSAFHALIAISLSQCNEINVHINIKTERKVKFW